jgi:hypothetical protein
MRKEIIHGSDLFDDRGNLTQIGWAKQLHPVGSVSSSINGSVSK